jgi:arylsulfatase A-like enzyme
MQSCRPERKLDGLFIALSMSLVFLVLSFLRTIGDMGSASFGTGVIESALAQPIIGTQLGDELIQFGLTLVFVHAFVASVCWGLARATRSAFPKIGSSQRVLTVFWLVIVMSWVLAANAFWYPRTALGQPYSGLVKSGIAGISLFSILSLVVGALILATLVKVCIDRIPRINRIRMAWIGGTALLAAGAALPLVKSFGSASRYAEDGPPQVILIGIDSLRTDFVQNETHQWTPALDRFLSEAVLFSDAVTPLARTFPAWASIVTGQHPHTTGAIINLLPRDQIELEQTLPSILSDAGYQTVYAIDEVRFSNLDASYGFDRILTPPMGAADFMIGYFSDTPLANVLVNTWVGKQLFPYLYGNRAAAKTYDPDTFNDWLDDEVSFDRPTFLAAHLTLAHWPYTWATAPSPRHPDSPAITKDNSNRGLYEVAIDRVDRQFGDLLAALERKGALENAIVIVLSDHGESLGESSRLTEFGDTRDLPLDTQHLIGHGTHVFSRDQYNVVLAVRSYGNSLVQGESSRVVQEAVTLEDIAPSIVELLGLETTQEFDGMSFAPQLSGAPSPPAFDGRIRFLETEFNPPGISPEGIISISAVLSAAESYEVDPDTDLVLVRMENIDAILAARHYAAEQDGRILASVPTETTKEQYLLYFDPQREAFEWLKGKPDAQGDTDIFRLWTALEHRFASVRNREVMPPPAANSAFN